MADNPRINSIDVARLFAITAAVCLLLGLGYHSLKNRRRLTYEHHSKN